MIDWSTCTAVERDPQRVSGAWVFCGTRVPLAALFENLEDWAQLSEFIDWFPGIALEQARAVLEHAAHSSAYAVRSRRSRTAAQTSLRPPGIHRA